MNINQLMKQAQLLQKKVAKKEAELNADVHEFEGSNQLIKGKINGALEILELEIDPSLCNSEVKEDLEALIVVTINKVIRDITEKKNKELSAITGGAKGLF